MISACLDLHHDKRASNCGMDVARPLFRVTDIATTTPVSEDDGTTIEEPASATCDVDTVSASEIPSHSYSDSVHDNVLFYIAGRAVGKYASYHGKAHRTCLEQIEVDRAIAQFSSKNQLVTFSKAYDKRELDFGGTGLRIPTDKFLTLLRQLNQCFENRFDALAHQRKIAA